MKKFLSSILVVILVAAFMPMGILGTTANAAYEFTSGYFTYTVNTGVLNASGGVAKIVDCNSSITGSVTIPSSFGNYTVTGIDSSAFQGCYGITNITIPNNVTSISDYAFKGCSNLLSVTIPDNVTYIGYEAFKNCSKLASVKIGKSVTNIDDYAFEGCTALTTVNFNATNCNSVGDSVFGSNPKIKTINIGSYVQKIPADIFEKCAMVTSITIPDSVTGIGGWAFYGCVGLKSVSIGKNVKNISNSAFAGCSDLGAISVKSGNANYHSKNNCLIETDTNRLILGCKNSSIPDYITSIGDSAFRDCYGLTSFVIPNSVTSISDYAFMDCRNLETITLSSNIKYIGFAFVNCDKLADVYYNGRFSDKSNIEINKNDDCLNAIWHYDCDEHKNTLNDGYTCENCGYSKQPSNPTVESISHNSVSLEYYPYLEYSNDGVSWQKSNVFEGLSSGTEYTFYQRVVTSDAFLVSEKSQGTTINTKKLSYITFNSNGGSGTTPQKLTKIEGEFITIPLQTPTREGYVFAGWGTLEKCGKQYMPNDNIEIDENINLYALWYKLGVCSQCDGTGNEDTEVCYSCNGTGKYNIRVCSRCGGTNLTQHITGVGNLGYMCNNCLSWSNTVKSQNCFNCSGNGEVNVICNVCDGDGYGTPQKPTAPVVVEFTDKEVVLLEQEGCEYSKDGIIWQESNVFSNLLPGRYYTFYIRVAATNSTPFAPISFGETVKTDKAKQELIPYAPTIQSITINSITLTCIDGYEYSVDGITYTSSPVFTNLKPATIYTFYQRIAETETMIASVQSESVSVWTRVLAPTLASKTAYTVELSAVNGFEYSIDGENWQVSPLFTDLEPETEYTFYQRVAAVGDISASEKSESLVVTTNEIPVHVHDYNVPASDDTHHWNECSCGEFEEKFEHEFEAATDETHHWTKCECGEETEKVEHKYDILQKTDEEHWLECECGKDELPYHFGHSLSRNYDDTHHWLDCICGYSEDFGEHVFDDEYDADCSCGYTREVPTRPVQNGWVDVDGTWYFYENGVMVTNEWRKDSVGWCYLLEDGRMATNMWLPDSKGWCYIEADGYCATNCWKKDSVGWIWLDGEGSMTKNQWILDGGKWYYLDHNGYMVINSWMADSIGWVYVGGDGAMVTNQWVMDSVGWCYVGADGYAVTNCWKQDSTGWCYLNSEGSMTISDWVWDNGWYYCDQDGYMLANTSRYIKDKTYHFNASGICTNP